MRISDEERREVARRLRGLDEGIDGVPLLCTRQEHDAMALCAIRAVVGKGDVFHLLADLIDRPTCTVVSVIFHDERAEYEVELSCGHSIATTGSAEDLVFCPRCGAEVVPDGC